MKKYCKDCSRWYHSTGADQCDIPRKLITEELAEKFFKYSYDRERKNRGYYIATGTGKSYWFGHPTDLNLNNDCLFFRETLWFRIKKLLGGVKE